MAETAWRGSRSWRMWLAVGLGTVVLLVLVLARCAPEPDGAATPDRADAPRPGDDSVVVEPTSTTPPPEASRAATEFTRAWLLHPPGESTQQWWQRVSVHTEPIFAQRLTLTDPNRVPGSELRGEPTPVSASVNRAVFEIATDAGRVAVTVVRLGAQSDAAPQVWRVSDIVPAPDGRDDTVATG